jgi:predicted XRE-type DNA-binding protein
MSSYVRWSDIRADQVERAGGTQTVGEGKQELLATVVGHRLAEVHNTQGLTQRQVADSMGVTKSHISLIIAVEGC